MQARDLVVTVDDVRLAGSLWTPERPPGGGVVMHPGSGPSDRDNDNLFPEVRPLLLSAGLAVASFDKRGVGGSGGDWRDAGIEEQAADLLAEVDTVRAALSGVPVGVYGHSQGGWVAVEAAARAGGGLAFVISSSGPAVGVIGQERYALARALERADPDRSPAVHAAFEAMVAGLSAPSFRKADEGARAGTDPAAVDWLRANAWWVGDAGEWALSRRLAAHEPSRALRALTSPLLVLYGAAERVVPVADSVQVLLRTVPPDLLTVVVVPGGDHRLRAGQPTALVPAVAPALRSFLDAVLGPGRTPAPAAAS